LKACADKRWIELGKQIHNLIEQNEKIDLIFKNCLISMYGKCGYLDQALKIFNSIKVSERDIKTWTIMISAYGENGKGKEALKLFCELQEKGIVPDNKTISCILKACCQSGLIEDAAEILFFMETKFGFKPSEYHYNFLLTACANNGFFSLGTQVHNYIIEKNSPQSLILKNNLINMYAKCGILQEAIKIFNNINISERDIITWTNMILAYGEAGKGKEALELFLKIQ
jgi:pentatricopeptide repeat protein